MRLPIRIQEMTAAYFPDIMHSLGIELTFADITSGLKASGNSAESANMTNYQACAIKSVERRFVLPSVGGYSVPHITEQDFAEDRKAVPSPALSDYTVESIYWCNAAGLIQATVRAIPEQTTSSDATFNDLFNAPSELA
jgi:hypothetical protein